MHKIHNAWNDHPGYNCFGCSADNPLGLHMEFFEDGDDIVSRWEPKANYQGWINQLHGGIQATLCDEIASWVVFRKLQTSGFTARMEVRYKKPVSTLESHVTLRARLVEKHHSLATIDIKLYNSADELCTQATCVYFVQTPDQAKAMGFKPFEIEE